MAGTGSGRSAAALPRLTSPDGWSAPLFGIALSFGLLLGAPSAIGAGPTAPTTAPTTLPAATAAGKAAPQPASQAPIKAVIVNPAWKELKPAQQQALAPLATEWDKLTPTHKSKWLAIARKYETMKPDEQNRVQERMRAWLALTPDQRRVARESYARTKKLNTDQKSAQWQQYQQLPDEQKKKLADEAAKNKVATLPPSQSKAKIVQPIKSAQKRQLQQSIMPHTAQASQAVPPVSAVPMPPAVAPPAPPAAPPAAVPAPVPAPVPVTPSNAAIER